jgi:hypothetical protein
LYDALQRLAERRIAAYNLTVEKNRLLDRLIEVSVEVDRLTDDNFDLHNSIEYLKEKVEYWRGLYVANALKLRQLRKIHNLCRSNRPIILYR